ncbi:MAG: hypothetical protein HRT61_07485, partial [Ekhidna sp.]|nr:hypothetical protein [Ekhidna sp.]
MFKQINRFAFAFAFLLNSLLFSGISHRLHGQEISNYGIKSLSQRDGLMSNKVTSILKDSKGFVWIGTDNGLNKFDGRTLSQFCLLDPCEELAENYVQDIIELQTGELIVASKLGAFVVSQDRSEIERIELDVAEYQAITLFGDSKKLLIGTDGSLYEVVFTENAYDHRVLLTKTDGFTEILQRGNQLWVGTWQSGLFIYDIEKEEWTEFNQKYNEALNGDSIKSVMVMADGHNQDLWVASYDYGLYHITKDFEVNFYEHDDNNPNSINSNKIKTLELDDKGYLWLGFEESGIDRFGPEVNEFIHYYSQFQDQGVYEGYGVYSTYLDDQNQIWVGFRNDGLKIIPLNPSIFDHHLLMEEDENNSVIGITATEDELYIGSKGSLLIGNSQLPDEFKNYQLPNNESPQAIYPIDKNEILIGTRLGSIFLFDNSTKSFNRFLKRQDESKFKGFKVNSFHQVSKDIILIGSQNGTFKFTRSTRELEFVEKTWTHTFLPADDGSIYFINFGKNQFQYFPETGKLNTVEVDIYKNVKAGVITNNTLYLGSDLGFFKYDLNTKSLKHYKSIYPLINSQVNALVLDRNGRIWASTHENVFCFDPIKETFRVFSESD